MGANKVIPPHDKVDPPPDKVNPLLTRLILLVTMSILFTGFTTQYAGLSVKHPTCHTTEATLLNQSSNTERCACVHSAVGLRVPVAAHLISPVNAPLAVL